MLEFILFIVFIYWLLRSGFKKTCQYKDPFKWGCGFLMIIAGILIVLLILI